MLQTDKAELRIFHKIFNEYTDDGLLDAVIIHEDYIISNWHSSGSDKVNYIFSCTKSILSSLIGIAIDKKLIKSVDMPITQYFPNLKEDETDKYKQQITIYHLLSMTSGIDWPPMDKGKIMYNKMVKSNDWTDFVLKRSVIEKPGTKFNYLSLIHI